jgi:hypothetical protein
VRAKSATQAVAQKVLHVLPISLNSRRTVCVWGGGGSAVERSGKLKPRQWDDTLNVTATGGKTQVSD